ncbi:MAG: hypothetical protein AAGD28_31870, partial [Bacteroidota bacterium]
MKANVLLLLFLFGLSFGLSQTQKGFGLYGSLRFGPHAVGFKQIKFEAKGLDGAREIQISLWYPAVESPDKLFFKDYLTYDTDRDDTALVQLLSTSIGGKANLFDSDSLRQILYAKMKASPEAHPSFGKFPLLLWSPRYGTLEYQNFIAEYLASHAYVIAFAEDVPNSSFPWQIQSPEHKKEVLAEQVDLLKSAVSYLKLQDNIDSSKIGLISWSYAGESALLTQMECPEIDLVIGLSAISFSSGVYLGGDLKEEIHLDKLS